ncbi:MAG: rhomboid family intramembrane serine protease, partial [Anaerohalosphaera sp.]|nr:rhomboid family intramembrane serine protease [Anaerohalosphaera sp.]
MLPLYTSIRPRRTPYANYILIALNVLIFLLTYAPHPALDAFGRPIMSQAPEPLRPWADLFMLVSLKPQIWQFVTYAFLHGGWMHLLGNMYFLYFFGNNVNDKLGNVGYLCFYLAGAVFSGLGHSIISDHNVLGASGAVAAVTGGYMVLFPRSLITIIYWFIIIGTIEIPAFFFIGFKLIVIDNMINRNTPSIAYGAHIAGYAAGIIIAMLLLALRLLPSDHSDMWSMAKQWNRRRKYRDTVAGGYD